MSADCHRKSDKFSSTEQCPKCRNRQLALLRVMGKKYCSGCNKLLDWFLRP